MIQKLRKCHIDQLFLRRKSMLKNQLFEIAEEPLVSILEQKKVLVGLVLLGSFGTPTTAEILRVPLSKDCCFLSSCSVYCITFPITLSRLDFSMISLTTKELGSIFGDNHIYTNRVVQRAWWEIENFVLLVKENAPSSETFSTLDATSSCVQATLSYCLMLES